MTDHRNITTIEPDKRSGKPCIGGMRITVYDILEYLAGGMTVNKIFDYFPKLTRENSKLFVAFAADHKVLTAGSLK